MLEIFNFSFIFCRRNWFGVWTKPECWNRPSRTNPETCWKPNGRHQDKKQSEENETHQRQVSSCWKGDRSSWYKQEFNKCSTKVNEECRKVIKCNSKVNDKCRKVIKCNTKVDDECGKVIGCRETSWNSWHVGIWPWHIHGWPWLKSRWPWFITSWPWYQVCWPWYQVCWPWYQTVPASQVMSFFFGVWCMFWTVKL